MAERFTYSCIFWYLFLVDRSNFSEFEIRLQYLKAGEIDLARLRLHVRNYLVWKRDVSMWKILWNFPHPFEILSFDLQLVRHLGTVLIRPAVNLNSSRGSRQRRKINWSLKKKGMVGKFLFFSTLTGCLGWSHYPHSNKISNIIEGLPSDKETDGNISYKSLQYHRGQIFSLAAPDPPWPTPERSTITETCRPCLTPDLLELLPVNHAVTILVELPEGGDNFLLACSLILIPESEYVIYGNVLPKLQLRYSADSNLSQLLASHSRKGFY